ncbi:hypothetical protein FORC065_4053 [Yersinia enterocolitica]|nr:hypothetical protein FORC065_4053 [Yersinia enterocolitica]
MTGLVVDAADHLSVDMINSVVHALDHLSVVMINSVVKTSQLS